MKVTRNEINSQEQRRSRRLIRIISHWTHAFFALQWLPLPTTIKLNYTPPQDRWMRLPPMIKLVPSYYPIGNWENHLCCEVLGYWEWHSTAEDLINEKSRCDWSQTFASDINFAKTINVPRCVRAYFHSTQMRWVLAFMHFGCEFNLIPIKLYSKVTDTIVLWNIIAALKLSIISV